MLEGSSFSLAFHSEGLPTGVGKCGYIDLKGDKSNESLLEREAIARAEGNFRRVR
jgi:hypothetical protein